MATKIHTYITYKKALDMILVRGLSYRETAKILGVSLSTVMTWMAEARNRAELIHRLDKK